MQTGFTFNALSTPSFLPSFLSFICLFASRVGFRIELALFSPVVVAVVAVTVGLGMNNYLENR